MVKKRREILKCIIVSKKLQQWSKDSINIFDTVASSRMGLNRAALEFIMPCTSHKD